MTEAYPIAGSGGTSCVPRISARCLDARERACPLLWEGRDHPGGSAIFRLPFWPWPAFPDEPRAKPRRGGPSAARGAEPVGLNAAGVA